MRNLEKRKWVEDCEEFIKKGNGWDCREWEKRCFWGCKKCSYSIIAYFFHFVKQSGQKRLRHFFAEALRLIFRDDRLVRFVLQGV